MATMVLMMVFFIMTMLMRMFFSRPVLMPVLVFIAIMTTHLCLTSS